MKRHHKLLIIKTGVEYCWIYRKYCTVAERGLFCCENVFAARFQLCNFDHRIDYDDFENRAFYLLLHRHLRNLLDRHCFATALHVAKLIFRLDPVGDPLAIMLTFDSIALKAREYDYLIKLYETLLVSKFIKFIKAWRAAWDYCDYAFRWWSAAVFVINS